MTKREKVLLIILFIICLLVSFVFTIEYSISSIKDSEASIIKYNEMINKLSTKKQNNTNKIPQKIVVSEVKRTETIEKILKDLEDSGIKPQKYQIIDNNNGVFIETKIMCSYTALVPCFSLIEKNTDPYSISNISIKNTDSSISATIRYKIEEVELIQPEKEINNRQITYMFRPSKKEIVVEVKKDIKETEKKDEIDIKTNNYSIIGWIKERDVSYLYIKQKELNKAIKIPSEKIIEETDEYVIINLDEKKVLIQKRH